MRRAIYPGSFDPVTNGHLDVVERARKLFDEVIVAVAHNDEKQPLFSLKERLDLLRRTVGKIDNVRIAQFKGLLVEFAKAEKAGAVIRGLRAISDFEFEFQMASDEPETRCGGRNNFPHAEGGIHLSQFSHCERNRAPRWRCLQFCPGVCGQGAEQRNLI